MNNKANQDGGAVPGISQAELDLKLKELQAADLDKAVVNVWVAVTVPANKAKRFTKIKRLKVKDSSKNKFKSYVVDCIQGASGISELTPMYTPQDDRFFYVESSATDLSQLISEVETQNLEAVKTIDELNGYNSYAIQVTFGEPEQSVFAYRYIRAAWSAKKTKGNFLDFKTVNGELVVEIDSSTRFEINPYLDFLQFKDDVFIANIASFEVAMNYHERLKEKKEEAIKALFESPNLVAGSEDVFKNLVGLDKRLMRQLAAAHEKGYYSNKEWVAKLRVAAEEAGNWRIKFNDQGEIEIDDDKDYIKELLILLQNKRVKTVVDGIVADVDGELIALAN